MQIGGGFFQFTQQRKAGKRLYLRLTFQNFEHYFTAMEPDILQHFQEIKAIIRQGQGQALQAVNAELIRVNWQLLFVHNSSRLPLALSCRGPALQSRGGGKTVAASGCGLWLQK
jgi:hypothetical protein